MSILFDESEESSGAEEVSQFERVNTISQSEPKQD
jgi:hypothetical protein